MSLFSSRFLYPSLTIDRVYRPWTCRIYLLALTVFLLLPTFCTYSYSSPSSSLAYSVADTHLPRRMTSVHPTSSIEPVPESTATLNAASSDVPASKQDTIVDPSRATTPEDQAIANDASKSHRPRKQFDSTNTPPPRKLTGAMSAHHHHNQHNENSAAAAATATPNSASSASSAHVSAESAAALVKTPALSNGAAAGLTPILPQPQNGQSQSAQQQVNIIQLSPSSMATATPARRARGARLSPPHLRRRLAAGRLIPCPCSSACCSLPSLSPRMARPPGPSAVVLLAAFPVSHRPHPVLRLTAATKSSRASIPQRTLAFRCLKWWCMGLQWCAGAMTRHLTLPRSSRLLALTSPSAPRSLSVKSSLVLM